VASEIELPLPRSTTPAAADLTLTLAPDAPVPDEPPPGSPLADLERDGRRVYSFRRDGDRVVLRYPHLCEFVGDRTLSTITVALDPGADRRILGVIAGGNLLAVHLMLRREFVLHASAVRHDGRAVAFVGVSGMGKSTLAAAYCAAGAALVTDDVMRIEFGPDGAVRVHPGATETRLRPSARELADSSPPETVRETADGRLAVRSRHLVPDALPLAACVVPRSDPEVRTLSVRRLGPMAALRWLILFPKIVGWCEPESLDHNFQSLGVLAERLPMFEVAVPWGLPFEPEMLAELMDGVLAPARAETAVPLPV
jgi:hypothetical protein